MHTAGEAVVSHAALDLFGKLLMQRVRDESIEEWDKTLDGRMKAPSLRRIHREFAGLEPSAQAFISRLIPQVVDTTLHYLLWTLEQEDTVRVAVEAGDESVPDLSEVSDGLSGEVYGEEGWFARFSSQRHLDPA
jgi:hypothetical protein